MTVLHPDSHQSGTDQDRTQAPLVTIIIPAMNEEGNIARLESALTAVVDPLPYRFEFLVLDNASTDATPELVKALCERDARWRYLRFTRTFSLEKSIAAGYHFATGDAMIVLYSDLQDPPALIPEFLEKWRNGYDVVYGVRTQRLGESKWRQARVHAAYRLISWCADVPIPKDTGDFRLISRAVRDALELCPESNRYMRGLIAWLGYRQIGVPYERQARQNGKSKFPFWSTVIYTLDAITSFSLKPLRLFLLIGFAMLLVVPAAVVIYVVSYFLGVGAFPRGFTTIVLLLFTGIGLNSIGIGVLGEYLGRTYFEVKRRPLYLVEEAVGFGGPIELPSSEKTNAWPPAASTTDAHILPQA